MLIKHAETTLNMETQNTIYVCLNNYSLKRMMWFYLAQQKSRPENLSDEYHLPYSEHWNLRWCFDPI